MPASVSSSAQATLRGAILDHLSCQDRPVKIWDIVTDLHEDSGTGSRAAMEDPDAATAELLSALRTLRASGQLVARSAPDWRAMGAGPRPTGLPGSLFLATRSQYAAWNAVYTVLLVRDDDHHPFRSARIWRHDTAPAAPSTRPAASPRAARTTCGPARLPPTSRAGSGRSPPPRTSDPPEHRTRPTPTPVREDPLPTPPADLLDPAAARARVIDYVARHPPAKPWDVVVGLYREAHWPTAQAPEATFCDLGLDARTSVILDAIRQARSDGDLVLLPSTTLRAAGVEPRSAHRYGHHYLATRAQAEQWTQPHYTVIVLRADGTDIIERGAVLRNVSLPDEAFCDFFNARLASDDWTRIVWRGQAADATDAETKAFAHARDEYSRLTWEQ